MHGVGGKWIARAFSEISAINRIPEPLPVLSQIEPDPTFPTVKFPNPEEKGVSYYYFFQLFSNFNFYNRHLMKQSNLLHIIVVL